VRTRLILLALAGLVVAGSLLTRLPAVSDRPILQGARIDAAVLAIIQRSCADCHSEATRYPWYSHVAPVSFLVVSDVAGGREHLNLSRWSEYPAIRRMRSLSEIANQVKDGEMPLWQYILIHRDAKLSAADVEAIFQWTQTERARLIAESNR
jgi:mono/diheme cytochrome c family protein